MMSMVSILINDQQHPITASLPLIHVLKIYEAQPTPGVTLMASAGQFVAHAPHSMQASLSIIAAFGFSTLKTL